MEISRSHHIIGESQYREEMARENLKTANKIINSLLDRGLDLEVSRKLEEAGFGRQQGTFVLTYSGRNIEASYTIRDLLDIKQKGEDENATNTEAESFLSRLINNYLEDI
ncbi:MAG: hypothetical protein PVJ67_00980 [Candidatus Pacearchaeota archaeon]|jgi:hypothetical protein